MQSVRLAIAASSRSGWREGLLRRYANTASSEANWSLHYRRCAKMYRYAPVNAADRFDARVRLGHKRAVVTMPPKAEYYHAAMALHGVNYFKVSPLSPCKVPAHAM